MLRFDHHEVEVEAFYPIVQADHPSSSYPPGKGNHRMLTQRTQVTWWQATTAPRSAFDDFDGLSILVYPFAKRAFDVLVAAILLLVLAPLLALIAIAIKLETPGPVFHIQRRIGVNGRVFRFYKFRSMTSDHDHTQEHRRFAEAYINGQASSASQDGNGRALYKPSSNGRTITKVGRLLRRTSMDELPQLFNIFKGDMSLVGPRPSMDYEAALYSDRHRQRLAVQPGLTGWAQVHGRSGLSFEEIVSLDLEYIKQRSILMDLRILLVTVPVVLSAENAG